MITALMFFAGAAMGQNSTNLPDKKVIEQAPAAVGLGFLIQQQLEEAGIPTALVSRPWPRLLERMKAGKVMAFLGGYWHGGGDVGHMLGAVVHSPQEGWGVSNYFGHPSQEADVLIEEASPRHSVPCANNACRTASGP